MRAPTRLPSVPPIQMTSHKTPLLRRVRMWLQDLVALIHGQEE